jgi:hypothetical protein
MNRLLRFMTDIGTKTKEHNPSSAALQVLRVAMSYGLVRLTHCFLYACGDLAIRQPVHRSDYLADRLVYGDQDAFQMRFLSEKSMQMVNSVLHQHGVTMPERWDTDFLLQSPPYKQAILEAFHRLLERPEQSINAPLSMELTQFGFQPDPRGETQAAVESGRYAVEVIKAFIVQELEVPSTLLTPPEVKLISVARGTRKQQDNTEEDHDQTKLI